MCLATVCESVVAGVATGIAGGLLTEKTKGNDQSQEQSEEEKCENDNIPRNPDPRCDPDGELNVRYHVLHEESNKNSCSKADLTLTQIKERIEIKEKYHAARKRHHDFCYQGGNTGHRQQLEQLDSEIKNCWKIHNDRKALEDKLLSIRRF